MITTFERAFGWTQPGGPGSDWVYDPHAGSNVNQLSRAYETGIKDAIGGDKKYSEAVFTNSIRADGTIAGAGTGNQPQKDLRGPPHGPGSNADQAILDQIDNLVWPPDTVTPAGVKSDFVSKFNLAKQYVPGPSNSSGYHLGNGYVGTAGHCVVEQLLDAKLSDQKVVFNWTGDVNRKVFSPQQEVFEIER